MRRALVSRVEPGLVRPGDAPERPAPMGRVLDPHVLERHAPVGRVRADPAVMTDGTIAVMTVERVGVTVNLQAVGPMVPVDAPTIGPVLVEALVLDPVVHDASIVVMTVVTSAVMAGVVRRRVPASVDSHRAKHVTRSGLRRTRPNDVALRCALVVPVRSAKASSRHESSALPRSGSTKARCARSPSRRPNEVVRRRRLRNVVMPSVRENSHPMWQPRSTTSSNRVVQRD